MDGAVIDQDRATSRSIAGEDGNRAGRYVVRDQLPAAGRLPGRLEEAQVLGALEVVK